jgi:predicted nucleic acid-binding protein
MSEKYFVDTNILIYAHDRSQGVKHERARQLIERLWASGRGVLSTQVLQELCVSLRRKVANPVSVDEIRRVIRDYLSWEIVVNTPDAVLQALEIEVRYKTSFWDALILQAAEQCGAAVLYSEDMSGKQRYGTVRVVNPLAA